MSHHTGTFPRASWHQTWGPTPRCRLPHMTTDSRCRCSEVLVWPLPLSLVRALAVLLAKYFDTTLYTKD